VSYISVFILVSSISYRYTSTGLATIVFSFFFSFFIGATVSAKLALSVPFACCWLSYFYEIVFYEQIKWWWWWWNNSTPTEQPQWCLAGNVLILLCDIISK